MPCALSHFTTRFQSVLVGSWGENQTLQLVVACRCAYHMGDLRIPLLHHQHSLEPSPLYSDLSTLLLALFDYATWIRVPQGVVQSIGVPVERLNSARPGHKDVRLQEAPQGGIIPPGAVEAQPQVALLALASEWGLAPFALVVRQRRTTRVAVRCVYFVATAGLTVAVSARGSSAGCRTGTPRRKSRRSRCRSRRPRPRRRRALTSRAFGTRGRFTPHAGGAQGIRVQEAQALGRAHRYRLKSAAEGEKPPQGLRKCLRALVMMSRGFQSRAPPLAPL